MNPQRLVTPGLHGYAVEYSPYDGNRVAIATGKNFGISGPGALIVAGCDGVSISELRRFETSDCVFDCAWSEDVPGNVVAALGDGTLQIWSVDGPQTTAPSAMFDEHSAEVYGVDWNLFAKTTFVSASWDNSVKVWDPLRAQSIGTYTHHRNVVYAAIWRPDSAGQFASVSGDGSVAIVDALRPSSSPVLQFQAHESEILTVDWDKYDTNIVVTGAVDGSIRGWDVRMVEAVSPNNPRPLFALTGHTYGIRRLKCSPHTSGVIASVSYDMTLRLWNARAVMGPPSPPSGQSSLLPSCAPGTLCDPRGGLLETLQLHSEFVVGIDFNIFREGEVADCSWDQSTVTCFPQSLARNASPML